MVDDEVNGAIGELYCRKFYDMECMCFNAVAAKYISYCDGNEQINVVLYCYVICIYFTFVSGAWWIINIRRDNVKIADIKSKGVCSAHFHEKAFNCPTDIQHSRLLPTAVPTIINCPNPPPSMECRRPPPKIREPAPKRRRQDIDNARASSSAYDEGDGDDCDGDSDSSRPVIKAPKRDPEMLARELEQAKLALDNFKKKKKT